MKSRIESRVVKVVEIPYEEIRQACELPDGYFLRGATIGHSMGDRIRENIIELTLEKRHHDHER